MATRSKSKPVEANDDLLAAGGVPVDALTPEPTAGPRRPDLTPAQLLAGIPVLAQLLEAFGLYTLSGDQQTALYATIAWGASLILGDAYLRGKRNDAVAKVEAARRAGQT